MNNSKSDLYIVEFLKGINNNFKFYKLFLEMLFDNNNIIFCIFLLFMNYG